MSHNIDQPIRSFELANFKLFSQSGQIPLRPITLLVGSNSSGKSSVIQSLLLLKQSMSDRAASSQRPSLVIHGGLFDGGSYQDIIHKHKLKTSLTYTFHFRSDGSTDRRPRSGSSIVQVKDNTLRRNFMPFFFPRQSSSPKSASVDGSVSLTYEANEPFGPSLSQVHAHFRDVGEARLQLSQDTSGQSYASVIESSFEAQGWKTPVFPASFLPYFATNDRPSQSPSSAIANATMQKLLDCVYSVFSHLGLFLNDMRMLGPFRQWPQRQYRFGGFASDDVGMTGQQAIDLLLAEYILGDYTATPLHEAVSEWLKRMGLAKKLSVQVLSRDAKLFELRLNNAGFAGKSNIVDVGFGVSQVLPVLVQGLLTPRGGTYIVQQPELHLHPDAQAALADFLLFLATRGINVIAETHSEYLLIRLRRRLAEHFVPPPLQGEEGIPRNVGREDIAVLCPTISADGGHQIHRIDIDEHFQFDHLPADFMNQAVLDRAALLRAIAKP